MTALVMASCAVWQLRPSFSEADQRSSRRSWRPLGDRPLRTRRIITRMASMATLLVQLRCGQCTVVRSLAYKCPGPVEMARCSSIDPLPPSAVMRPLVLRRLLGPRVIIASNSLDTECAALLVSSLRRRVRRRRSRLSSLCKIAID